MGSAISRLRLVWKTLRSISASYDVLERRIATSPGIPSPNPSISYWEVPPAPIAKHGSSSALPEYADIVVIGSGITGTAFSRTTLNILEKDMQPTIVMLEARDACSGATGRNGGHVTPVLFHDYPALKSAHGAANAQAILRFRLAHLPELLAVAQETGLADCQCREVETFDVFFEQETFDVAKENLKDYLRDMPDQRSNWRLVSAEDCVKDLQLSRKTVGAIGTIGGAIHPYRFVTGILSSLLESFPDQFRLLTHTPCLSISSDEDSYTITTNKGQIRARHVVHATNGWVSHLLAPMRGKIVPVRGHMSSQRPGLGLGHNSVPDGDSESMATLAEARNPWAGQRSFVMYAGGGYDYLTQQPVELITASSEYPAPAGEMMFGGGASHGEILDQALMDEVGVSDDTDWNTGNAAHLSGALSVYFDGWGAEGRGTEDKDTQFGAGRVKKLWSGILGISADGIPWVGRISPRISARSEPKSSGSSRLATPGEWIAAGYTGEGMVHAYLSAKALAHMVLATDEASLPAAFLVSEKRWRNARMENLVN